MSNPFDAFDEGASAPSAQEQGANPFDAFDQPSLDEGYSKLWSKAKDELHGIEDATNRVVAGGIGFMGAAIPTAAHRLYQNIKDPDNKGSFEQDFNVLSDKIAKGLIPATAQDAPDSAEKYNDFAADAFNRAGMAMVGVHGAIPYAKNMPKPKEFVKGDKFSNLDKMDEAAKPKTKNPFDSFDGPIDNVKQMELPLEDKLATKFDAAPESAVWRTDENGIPVKADLSMDAANVEAPLQRNLWGDELPPKHEQEALPLTEAIDSMPPGEARQSGIDMLSNGPIQGGRYGSQRGAINMDVFDPTYRKVKELENGVRLLFKGGKEGPIVIATDASGKRVGEAQFSHDTWARPPEGKDNLEAGWVTTDPNKMSNMPDASRIGSTTPSAHKGLSAEMYKFAAEQGNDVIRSGAQTPEGRAMWDKFEKRGLAFQGKIPASQRGSAPIINEMAKAVSNTISKGREAVENIGKTGLHHLTSKEDYLAKNIPGMKESLDSRISPAPKAADVITAAMDPKVTDIPKQGLVSSNIQSGLQQMSTKYRDNPVLLGAGRILDNMYTKTEHQIKQLVQPMMQTFQRLPIGERVELTKLFTREMFNEKRYTREELSRAGFSQKQVDAYDMLRAAHDEAFNVNNRGRELLGKDPITKSNAYLASLRQGDWQFSVLDNHGKAAWYVRSTTKAEALAAIEHLKEKFGGELQLNKVVPEFRKDSAKYHPDTPRDVMGAYQDMLRYFSDNPSLSKEISESMKGFAEQKGYDFAGHKNRFLDKANVRGFEGDKPWLSDKENSNALMKAQENYLKNSIQWNHAQEAMANIKELMSNEDLVNKMPNTVDMVQKVFNGQFGMTSSVFKAVEQTLAQLLPGYFNGKVAMGRSSSSLYHSSSAIKNALYIQLLGLNLTHMIATPIQGLITAPANHAFLTGKGFEHNVFKTTMSAMSDFAGGMMKHSLHDMTGKEIDVPMTAIGKKALKFAEDNNIIDKNLFNESVDLGSGPVGSAVKAIGGYTIAMPEKITRLASFMSFVHHLDASGKLSDMEVFQKAKEFTDNSLTGFGRQDRPMIVDKGGAGGSLAYTFKSYLFNYFNQLSTHAREAGRGNAKPLLYNLGMLTAVGGALSIPIVNEADGVWNLFKDFISEHAPEHYHLVAGRGLKEQIIAHLPDIASYGAASQLTGIGMQNKFGTDIADPERPLKNLFPMAQDLKEAASAVGALGHPNSTTGTEAVYQQMPKLIQGQMETRMPIFRGPQQSGGQIAMNPNDLMHPKAIDHLRTESDWNKRALGMTSLEESKDKQTGYSNSQESRRIKKATDEIGANLFEAAVRRQNPSDAKDEIIAYLKLNPDEQQLKADFMKRLNQTILTPSQRELIGAKTFQEINNVLRLRGTRGQP